MASSTFITKIGQAPGSFGELCTKPTVMIGFWDTREVWNNGKIITPTGP